MIASAGRTPEAELLLSCAHSRMDDARVDQARAALARGIRWDLLLRTADLQAVAPLLRLNLSRIGPELVPQAYADRLRRTCRSIAQLNLALAAELRRILQRFQGHDIRAIPFKGPVLAAGAYGSLTLRRFGDLDILVRDEDAKPARQLLAAAGYELGYHVPGQEYHFVDARRQFTVDLHQRIASSYFPAPDGFEVLWARSRPLTLAGGEVRGLSPEDTAFGLCVHLAKDYCTWKERLSQLCDLAELMAAEPALPWDRVVEHGRSAGGERIVLIALWLVADLLGTPVPEAARGAMERDVQVARLGGIIRERLLQQLDGSLEYLPYRGENLVEDFRFHLEVRERAADRARFVRDLLLNRTARLLRPNQWDYQFLRLPRRLRPLYYVVRPIRLARDRILRVRRGARWPSLLTHRLRRNP